jgi:hypothetical protein
MEALYNSLIQLLTAVLDVLISLGALLLPWLPLGAWVVFWMFGVNWSKLYPLLRQRWGGWIAVVLIGLVMILVWGSVAPPATGSHHVFGLELSNYIGKTVYVTALFCIVFLCGSVQLTGCCSRCCSFEEATETAEH